MCEGSDGQKKLLQDCKMDMGSVEVEVLSYFLCIYITTEMNKCDQILY